MTESTQWFFGAFIVLFHAHDRFKIPRPMRATTTFWRYWSAWCGYLVATTGVFMLLGGAFGSFDPRTLLDFLGVEANSFDQLPGPLLSALLLTSLLPHAPVLGKIDNSVKQWFRRVGNIPFEVRGLSKCLLEATYDPSAQVLEPLRPTLARFGVDPAWLKESPNTFKQPWAQTVTLFAQVQSWEGARGYGHYVDDNKAVLVDIRAKLESLAEMLQLPVLAELDGGHDSPFLARIRARIAHDVGELRKSLCDVVSGGVLSETRTHGQRMAALGKLGFTGLPAVRSSLNANDIVLVMGLVFLAMLFIPLTVRRFFDPTPLAPQVRLYILIPIVYAIAVVAAIYPKSAWRFARRKPDEGRPAAGYAASGILAAVAAFVVSLILRFAFNAEGNIFQVLGAEGSFNTAWTQSLERWPWHLMTFFTTVAIAWMADDCANASKEPVWLRWAEAAGLAAIFVALQWTVAELFAAVGNPMATTLREHLMTSITVAAAIGASIGWFVPYTYRSRGRPAGAVPVTTAPPRGRPPAAVDAAASVEAPTGPSLTRARPSDIAPRIPVSSA